MNLRLKITGIIAMLAALWALVSFLVLRVAVAPGFTEVENSLAKSNVERVRYALDSMVDLSMSINRDWSPWDATYNYVKGIGSTYEGENLTFDTMLNLDLDVIVMLDRQSNVVWGRALDYHAEDFLPPETVLGDLGQFANLLDLDSADVSGISGWAEGARSPVALSVLPILRSDYGGPPAGTFIVGLELGERRAEELRARAKLDFRFSPRKHAGFDSPGAERRVDELQPDEQELVETEESLISYSRIADIFERDGLVLRVDTRRDVSSIGSHVLMLSAAFLFVAGLIFVLAIAVMIRRQVISPVYKLSQHVASVQASGNLAAKIDLGREDEIGELADQFDRLTDQLSATYEEMESARDAALDASRAKSAFLATMSHEIRTPINGVIGSTDLLLTTELEAKQKRFASVIQSSAQNLLKLIDDVLDFSKIEAEKVELELVEFQPRDLVEDVLEGLACGALDKGLNIVSSIPADFSPICLGDEGKIHQIVTNLVSNAIKFTDTGEVVVRVRPLDGQDSGNTLRFEVKDTGAGIPEDVQAKIFDSFTQADASTTRRYGGSGLGLAICSGLVKEMGGQIALESNPGNGARFWFDLPLEIVGEGGTLIDPDAQGAFQDRDILIVDDSATNRTLLKEQLLAWGMKCDACESGYLALEALRAKRYDLILADCEMPLMTGLEFAERVREDKKSVGTPVVLLSSNVDLDLAEHSRTLDIADCLHRPVKRAALMECLVATFVHRADDISPSAQKAESSVPVSARTILLVDDQSANLEVVSAMLESFGYEVQVARHGEEALEQVQAKSFDCILMDCEMPVMDGYSATQAMRERNVRTPHGDKVPIIALTANVTPGARDRCIAAGMDDYLSKPIRLKELGRFLEKMFGSKSTIAQESSVGEGTLDHSDIVDESVLAGIQELSSATGKDLLSGVLQKFTEDSVGLIQKLKVDLQAENAESVRQGAHALKSSSLQLGSREFAQTCLELEERASDDNLVGGEALLSALEESRSRFLEEMNRRSEAGSDPEQQCVNAEHELRALIVDDEETTRMLLREFLENEGFLVTEAADGVSAIAAFEADAPSLILMDVEMPGLDGIDACEQIRSRPGGKTVKILILTGHTSGDLVARAGRAGASDFVSKPVNWKKLRVLLPQGEGDAPRVHVVTASISKDNRSRVVYEVFDYLNDAENFTHTIDFELEARIDSMVIRPPASSTRFVKKKRYA